MSDTNFSGNGKAIVCIHGMWCRPHVWEPFKFSMQAQGYQVHTPALPMHESKENMSNVAIGNVSLSEYIAAMKRFLQEFDEPPIVIGHSMGGLIAQAVAAEGLASHLVLLNSASPAGISAFRWAPIRYFWRWFMIPYFWRKPLVLSLEEALTGMFNGADPQTASERMNELGPESGRAAAEIAFWFLDKNRVSKVEFAAVRCPVLVIASENDRMTPASVSRNIAKKYTQAEYHEIPAMGHWTLDDKPLQHIVALLESRLS